jgi:hypothetical protein
MGTEEENVQRSTSNAQRFNPASRAAGFAKRVVDRLVLKTML